MEIELRSSVVIDCNPRSHVLDHSAKPPKFYPSKMESKVENENNFSASFLDLALAVTEGVIDTKLFDKRDAFNFSVVRMPYKCSNIPCKMFYSTIGAEALRICRATSHYNFFLISAGSLINIMRKQGADTQGIQRVITKMIGRHWKPFEKYRIAAKQIAMEISSST